jgi:hypothetical protein
MRKVRTAGPRRAAQGVPATRKVPMAGGLCEARTAALLPSVRMVERRIARPLMEALAMALRYIVVRCMPVPFTGHMSEHPITVQSSRV